MRGTTGFRDQEVSCIIGVRPAERQAEQPLVVDLAMEYDFSRAAARDDLADAVDYSAVARLVADHLRESRYGLLEAAAVGVASLITTSYPVVRRVIVELRKPRAMSGSAVSYVRFDTAQE
ncbi:dihydroneopterin aldolase [Alkalispirochaeta americana]|uniref:dihydroneopterin aldolase n=1 Tax=Alkalispirochaeta americana TaxID=159291 RepID=A0A1N6QY06_9SPIO|nr:dihydroneopterin aldolase [Alkalispirochaeta americana]SIQ21491.1 dihydroneopterin aldolase [Alkalispirochaeta americana]